MRSRRDVERIIRILENTAWLYSGERKLLESFLTQHRLRRPLSEKQWWTVGKIERRLAWRQNREVMRG